MPREQRDCHIALFIDFENLVTRTGVTPEQFDVRPAIEQLLTKGKVVYRRAYADWDRFAGAKQALHDQGVELMDVPPSTRTGKNGADIRLVIDALELSYLREHVDTFALASGDSDFCPLAYKLRETGHTVIGLAMRDSASPLFVKACDEFIYLRAGSGAKPRRGRVTSVAASAPPAAPAPPAEVAEGAEVAAPEAAAPAKRSRRRGGAKAAAGKPVAAKTAPAPAPAKPAPKAAPPKPAPQKAAPPKPASAVPDVARNAAAALLSRATEPVNPSALKAAIVRQQPDFNVREHGYSTFSRLLEAMEGEGLLKREKSERGQLYIVPA